MICNNCGAQIADESVFCPNCGAGVTQPDNTTYQQPQTQYSQTQYSQADYSQPQAQQPQANYSQPQYTNQAFQQPEVQPGRGVAIASLATGIASLVCCFPCLTGIAAIICGIVAKNSGYRGGMATWGIVTGIAGLVLSLLATIGYTIYFAANM